MQDHLRWRKSLRREQGGLLWLRTEIWISSLSPPEILPWGYKWVQITLKTRKVNSPCTFRLGKGKISSLFQDLLRCCRYIVNTEQRSLFPPLTLFMCHLKITCRSLPRAGREKHAYSWSDKYLSGIYLNERVHLQTFPGSEILSWAHREDNFLW